MPDRNDPGKRKRILGVQEREEITQGVFEMTGGDRHRAQGEGPTFIMRHTKYNRMKEGKNECTCGRFIELVVKIPNFSISMSIINI